MKRAAAFAIAAVLGCAARPEPIDLGELSGAVYRNAALDLRVTLPPGWAFLSREEVAAGVEAAYADRPRSERPALGESTLFTMVDRAHAPAPGRARRSVAAHAQMLRDPPAGLTSETIAIELERSLRAGDVPVRIGTRGQAIVGGRRFAVVATEMERGGIRGRLDHYIRYEPDRLVVLTFSYPPEESAPPQIAIEAIQPLASKGKP